MVNALIVGQKDNWMWFLMFPVKKSLSVILAMLSLAFLICRLFKVSKFFQKFNRYIPTKYHDLER